MKINFKIPGRLGLTTLSISLILLLAALSVGCGSAQDSTPDRTASARGNPGIGHPGPSGAGRTSPADWTCLSEVPVDRRSEWGSLQDRLGYQQITEFTKFNPDGTPLRNAASAEFDLSGDFLDPDSDGDTIDSFATVPVEISHQGRIIARGPGGSASGGLPGLPLLSTLPTISRENIVFSVNEPQARFLCAFRDVVGETIASGRNVLLDEFGLLGLHEEGDETDWVSSRAESVGDKILVFEPYLGLVQELSEPQNRDLIIAWDPVQPAPAMNKAELIESIASESGLSKADSKRALEGFINATTKALKKGDRISLIGFGSFSISKRAARTGRNPQTGEEIKIAAKKVVKFKAGAELSKAVN